MLSIFSHACGPSVYLLWRNIYLGLLPIFWLGCFLCCCVFWKLTPFWLDHLQIFSLILRVVSSSCSWFPWLWQKLLIRSYLLIFAFISFMWNLKNNTNESIYKMENRLTDIENKLVVAKGKREVGGGTN